VPIHLAVFPDHGPIAHEGYRRGEHHAVGDELRRLQQRLPYPCGLRPMVVNQGVIQAEEE